MMTLKEIGATLTTLLSRADGALKAEVESLKATVEGALADANAQLSAALAENQSLKGSVEKLTATNTSLGTELTAALSEVGSINAAITDACLAGKLLEVADRDAAMKLPIADKFNAYKGAVNAAMAKLNLPLGQMPEAPGSVAAQSMTRTQFNSLTPADRLAASKRGVKLTD